MNQYAVGKQTNYSDASILLRNVFLIPDLVPIVPGAGLVVVLHPFVNETGTTGSTSRGAHQPGSVNDALLGTRC